MTDYFGPDLRAEFSPDGTRIVTVSVNNPTRIWDAFSGAVRATLTGHKGLVSNAEFSPDGTRILTASEDNTARIWDASSGAELAILTGHEDTVWEALFSPDGTRIVTVSSDKTARIWDVSSGPALATLGHEADVRNEQFSPDGTRIVKASEDNTARTWDLALDTEPPPGWFKTFLCCLGRRSHSANGEITVWPKQADEAQVATNLRLAISADHTRYGDIARFLLTSGPEKPTYIGSKVTCGAAADQLIRTSASRSDLERALSWHPGHPLVQIALAKFEGNHTRAEFLREYGVSRLLTRQSSAQETVDKVAEYCRRAAALLIDQNDQPRATLVLDRASALAPRHPDLNQLRDDLARLKINPGAVIPPPPPELETLIPAP